MSEGSLEEQKRALRLALRKSRADAAEHAHAAALAVRDLFLAQVPLPPHAAVAFYIAQVDELDPGPLAQVLETLGHPLCLPCVGHAQKPLVFRAYQSGDFFRLGSLRIPEPLPTAPLVVPDVLLVPLLGFDRACHRLGQGGGFYDRTLAALRAEKKILAVGTAFAAQELPLIPTGPHDAPLDAIVTEHGVFH